MTRSVIRLSVLSLAAGLAIVAGSAPAQFLSDLKTTFFRTSNTNLRAGAIVSLSARVDNIGIWPSDPCRTAWVISRDATISRADRIIGDWATNGLGITGWHRVTTNVRMPTDLRDGVCWLGAFADWKNELSELSDSNNGLGLQARCIGIADLAITRWKTSTTQWKRGIQVRTDSSITNVGGGASAGFTNGIYLSRDSVISGNDILIRSWNVGPLGPGGRWDATWIDTIPNSAPLGPCYLGISADRLGRIDERSEENNTASTAGQCLDKDPPKLPDISILSFTASTTKWQPGDRVLMKSRTKNSGTAATPGPGFSNGFYLSSDSLISSTDTLLLSYRWQGSMAVGIEWQHNANVTMPRTMTPGGCFVGLLADRQGELNELNEGNNSAALGGNCIVAKPDLVVSTVASTDAFQAGTQVSVIVTTTNTGDAPAPNTTTALFLSRDSDITPRSDILLAQYGTGALGPNGSKQAVLRAVIPFCLPAGRYFVGARADMDDVADEESELNNINATLIKNVAEYTGGRKVMEFVPSYGGQVTSIGQARISAGQGGAADMCLYARGLANKLYFVVWSRNSISPIPDDLFGFSFGASLAQSPMFFRWFQRLDATGRGYARFEAPPTPGIGGFRAFAHAIFVDPTSFQVLGTADTRLLFDIVR